MRACGIAVGQALEEIIRRQRVRVLVSALGTLDLASNTEIEAGDLEEIARREAGAGT